MKGLADTGVISKYAIPERLPFVDQPSVTSVGKLNKNELREKYGVM